MSTPAIQTDAKRRTLHVPTVGLELTMVVGYTVLSRIQGLLIPQQDASLSFRDKILDASSQHNYTPAGQGRRLDAKFLKVRVITWNMHDSLPKVWLGHFELTTSLHLR